ncbi:transcriptional regulator (plasmid) [Cupriavidus sp. USMAA2-4]|nr:MULTISPECIES: LysR family transcriptional regulator [Burkholderiaceae]AOY97668.1 transcriptional regulator [Cupriavidus sp. USMAA2-4]
MISIERVQSFLAVVEAGGFREATKRIGISQSAITQHVKQLEEDLHAKLIERSNAGCSLTPEGRIFFPVAEDLVRLANKASTLFEREELGVGASSNTGIYLLQPYIKKYRESCRFPLNISIANNDAVARSLESFDIDVAVVETWDSRPGFTAKLWRTEELVLIVPNDHPWASLDFVRPEQLEDQVLIGGEAGSGTGRTLRRYLGGTADRIGVSLQLGSTAAVKQAVQAGLGISVVMKASVTNEAGLKLFSIVPFAGEPPRKELYIVYREGTEQRAPLSSFLKTLETETF